MPCDKGTIVVTASALLTLSSISLLCCPTARAQRPGNAPGYAQPVAVPAPAESEDSLDDDRAEHWAVPGIAREERVQSEVLVAVLLGVGTLGARRRGRLKGQQRDG